LVGLSIHMVSLTTRQISLISIMSAASIAIAYSKDLVAFIPGVEFMTVLIFVTGYCFGRVIGFPVGVIALTIYMLIPYPFAHPAAWLFTTSPILLVVMALLGGMYGVAGDLLSRRFTPKRELGYALVMGVAGFVLTFIYDIMSSVGFALAYPAFTTIWQSIVYTFIPLYMPYPPIVHTITNSIIFAVVAPSLIIAIRNLPDPAVQRNDDDS